MIGLRPKAVLSACSSLVYAIIIKGSLTLMVDNEERTLHQGDVCVQRGTFHGWKNETEEWCKFYAVTIGEDSKNLLVFLQLGREGFFTNLLPLLDRFTSH